tara:strand:+ start:110 stop:412 length:303 start_codon:yes stop_codon:yes gene_type:complete
VIYRVDMLKIATSWLNRATPKPLYRENPITEYEIKELSRVESPIDEEGEWWKYKLVCNDNVINGYRCGTEEDMHKYLNMVTGKINNRLFGHMSNRGKVKS